MATLDQAITQMLADGMPDFPDGGPRLGTNRAIRYGPKRAAWYRLFEFEARNGKRYISGAYGIWGRLDSTKIRTDFSFMDMAERERLQRSMAELEAQDRAKRLQKARFASARARDQWHQARPELPAGVECEYLKRKGVEAEKGLRFALDGTLLLPMIRYDVTEKQEADPDYHGPRRMVGVQKIAADGTKRFNKGMAKEGAMCRLGDAKDGELVIVVEGLATGLSIRMATERRVPVFVAFDAYNLAPAAAILRALLPNSRILFCADDDWKTEGNPGKTRALRAAAAVGNADVVVPIFAEKRGDKDTDYNDLHAMAGLAIVAMQLAALLDRPAEKKGLRESARTASSGGGESSDPDDDDGEDKGSNWQPPPVDPKDLRPNIWVRQGHLHDVVDLAEAALIEAKEEIYQRDRMLVRVMRRAVPSVRNYKRAAGSLGIVPVELPYLVETMTRVARWWRWDPRGKGAWVRVNAPDKIAATYMARAGQWRLPELWAVITAPTLRPDGTILQDPGYDAAMKAWYDPCGVKFPRIPEQPTIAQAEAAFKRLSNAFGSIPFGPEVNKSVAISAALCALVRRSLTSAPLVAITAPVMGAGKTLLADCISILAMGVSAPAMTYPDKEEEAKKTALAVLMEGDPVLLIDNVERPLLGDWLCVILTSETFSQRMLGRSEMAKVLTTCLFMATGNNLVVQGDLRTRTLLCRIDPGVERAEEREFKVELRDYFLEHRAELVAAGLTVMRAYLVSDAGAIVKPFGRFERWSDMVRSPIVWMGMVDPCASIKSLERDDPDRIALLQVLAAWHAKFPDLDKTSAEVLVEAKNAHMDSHLASPKDTALAEALIDICRNRDGQWDARRLSAWLRKHVDRHVEGMVLVKAGEKDHVLKWRVDKVDV